YLCPRPIRGRQQKQGDGCTAPNATDGKKIRSPSRMVSACAAMDHSLTQVKMMTDSLPNNRNGRTMTETVETTPTDAIAGLRKWNDEWPHWKFTEHQHNTQRLVLDYSDGAAAAIDALQARVKELE